MGCGGSSWHGDWRPWRSPDEGMACPQPLRDAMGTIAFVTEGGPTVLHGHAVDVDHTETPHVDLRIWRVNYNNYTGTPERGCK